jgi:GntR family transcriptional regulator
MIHWNDKEPIYVQIRDMIASAIIDGSLAPGETLPSVRAFSGDYQVNPITVSKAYQELVELGAVAKRRGVGMFVCDNAGELLLNTERGKFMRDEWPKLEKKLKRLGITLEELLA